MKNKTAFRFLIRTTWAVLFCFTLNVDPPQHTWASAKILSSQVFLPLILTPACDTDYAYLYLSPSSPEIQVGQALTITATLRNYGCPNLGEPQYRLSVDTSPTLPALTPANTEPVTHYLAVGPGLMDHAEFIFQGVTSGQASFQGNVSFEVHLGYPGPAYWGGAASLPITVTVTGP